MALSGYFYGTTANARIKPKLSWSAVQNVEENYSDITVTLSYSRTNTGYTTAGNWSGAITLGDRTETGKKYISVTYQSDTQAMTATFRMPHDEYGVLKTKLSAEGKIYDPADSTLKDTVISAVIQPDTIPRASTVSAGNAPIGSRATVVIGRRAETFTHSLAYRFGQLTGWVSRDGEATDGEQRFTETTVNFLLPERFYGEIPQSTALTCYLTCYTYQGEALIGQRETAFTATADESLCAPSLTVTARDVNSASLALTGDEGSFIRYLSQAMCHIEANARYGAHLTQVQAWWTPLLQSEEQVSQFTCDHQLQVDADRMQFAATDSRGFTTVFSLELNPIGYVVLTSNATVQRTDPTSGDAVLTLQGNCYCGSFPQKDNTLTATYQTPEQSGTVAVELSDDHTYRLALPLTGLDYRQSHTVRITLTDAAATVTQELTVHKGLPVFDWGEADFQFHVPVEVPALTVNGVPLADYIRAVVAGG